MGRCHDQCGARSGSPQLLSHSCVADRPRSHELTTLRKDDGTKLSVTNWIVSHELWKCVDFANMLLRDYVLVRRYENDGMGKDEFVRTVLRDWLSRDDSDQLNDTAVPRTWAALAECVTDAGLAGALAKAIIDTCTLPSGEAQLYWRTATWC